MRIAILAPLILMTFGCATQGHYGRSVHGTVGGYSMRNVDAKPINLMVAKRSEAPLYIVLDANRVKDTWPMATAQCATKSPGCERFDLRHMHEFVRRDLKASMQAYFGTVKVVASPQEVPDGPAVIADVKVDDVRINSLVRGALRYQIIEMRWGFALRRSDTEAYAFSFAGSAVSQDSYPTFEAGCAQLVENAIATMLKQWLEEGGGLNGLRGAPPEPPPTPSKV